MRNSILIVDDSEDTLELFQSTLEEQGDLPPKKWTQFTQPWPASRTLLAT